jgi:hypothetical protein
MSTGPLTGAAFEFYLNLGNPPKMRDSTPVLSLCIVDMQDVYKREEAAAPLPDSLESSDEASRKSGPVLCSVTRSVIGDKMSRATVASP